MISTLVALGLVCCGSLLVGRAALSIAGEDRWTWLEPAVGFAALVTVTGVLGRLYGHATSAGVGVLLLLVISLVIVLRRPYAAPGALRIGLTVAAIVTIGLTLPFIINGRWGPLGVGLNNDLGLHLAWSEWLRTGIGPAPVVGYPIGPHALADVVASLPRINLGPSFIGMVMAITVLTGLTSLGLLTGLKTWSRIVVASLAALSYLSVSYYAQAAFKELALGLFVVAFALALTQATRTGLRPYRRGIGPMLVIALGIAFTYSFAGLAWPIAILGIWTLATPAARAKLEPRRVLGHLKNWRVVGLIGAGFAAVVFLAFVGPFGFVGGFSDVAGADTFGPVSPLEALGIWPTPYYRLDGLERLAHPAIFGAIGVLVLLIGIVTLYRRRDTVIASALAGCVTLYLIALALTGDYSRAKALIVASPLVMLIVAGALLSGPSSAIGPEKARRLPIRMGWIVIAIVFIGGAVYSSFITLRQAPVGPPGHGAELQAFIPEIRGQQVIYAGQDRFAAYELRGADAAVPLVEFPDDRILESPTKPFSTGTAYSPIDFDSFSFGTLNHTPYVITSAAAWDSKPPPNFRRVSRTPSYILWKQFAETPINRNTFLEGGEAAAKVDCVAPETKIFVAGKGIAWLFPDPVIGGIETWSNGDRPGLGDETSQTFTLPKGTWRLSLQYFSPVDLTLGAPGFEQVLPAALDGERPSTISLKNSGQYWPAGQFTQSVGGPVTFTIKVAGRSAIQKLSGFSGSAHLSRLVAVPNKPDSVVRLGNTCGRWIDHYQRAGWP